MYQYLKEPGPVKVEVRLRSQRLKFLRENLATYSDTVPEVAGMVDGFKFLRRATRKGKLDHVSLEIPREGDFFCSFFPSPPSSGSIQLPVLLLASHVPDSGLLWFYIVMIFVCS